jgi:cell wall assembly regulator SMI1
MRIADRWARFDAALPSLGLPGVALAPGVSDAALEEFETATQLHLPVGVRQWFQGHDGQTSNKAGLAAGFYFVSLSEAQKLMTDWATTLTKLGTGVKDLDRACRSHPPKAIQRKYSTPAWLPLARDSEGNCVGVDLNPGPAGSSGQVINFGRDEEDKYVLFPSAAGLLEWLTAELEAGHIALDIEDGVVRHIAGRLVSAIIDSQGVD